MRLAGVCCGRLFRSEWRFRTSLVAWTAFLSLWILSPPALAIPPIVSGDVPTTEKGHSELFVGYLQSESGDTTAREVPFLELVYGLTVRQELTIETPLIFLDDTTGTEGGLGDVVIGTKYRMVGQPDEDSGLSASLEVKLPTGDQDRGLSSGATDVDLRVRFGRQIRREVVYGNVGHTWVGENRGEQLDNRWFVSGVWDHPAGSKVRLLSEVYFRTPSDPAGANRLAATIGIKWRVLPKQQCHLSIGSSLRAHAEGGPRLRVYAGWRWDF